MKNIYYKITFVLLFFLFFLKNDLLYSQCPGNTVPSGLAYDTTVYTGSGNYSTQFTFPKFNPQNGLLTCVKVCLSITGIVSMYLENNVNAPTTYNISYIRNDTLTGPGLTPSLTNKVSLHYGPFNLAASDGVPFSGPDFLKIGPDTILNSVSMCNTLNDSSGLSQFYGLDSLTYTYIIHAGATVTGSGDYLFDVSTQGSVTYTLQYCYCPNAILPINIQQFLLTKIAPDRAQLNWTAYDDHNNNYHYEVQMSRDGYHFLTIGSMPINAENDNSGYKFLYAAGFNENGRYFFRIKQVYSNGYSIFTDIKFVELQNSSPPEINIYPNPSNNVVGIKFVNNSSGKYLIQITNILGQVVWRMGLDVAGNSYRQITSLQHGTYWVKVTDVTSRLSSVNQLFIK